MASASAITIDTHLFATTGQRTFRYTDNGTIVHIDAHYFISAEINFVR